MNGPFDDVPVDRSVTSQVDWEVELGVIIGTTGKNIRGTERAGARLRLHRHQRRQRPRRPDCSTAASGSRARASTARARWGRCVVTADEFGDPQAKRLQCRVNGVSKQDASTADMIFPVATIIEWLSKGLTLEAGDVIATGTPSGVGMGRTPQEFLQNGDVVETEIEGIGTLRNRIAG